MPHTSPYTARAIGLTDECDGDLRAAAPVELHTSARADDGRKPQSKQEPQWQFYLPTKFDEGNSETVQFPAFGWQNLVQRVAVQLGMEQRDIKGKEKHGNDRMVCAIMQPYHLFREYYLARMNNKNCWATKYFGVADMCEKVKMADWFNNLTPLLGPDCALLQITPRTFVLPEEREQLRCFMQSSATDGQDATTMIVKPVGGSQGKGIFITQKFEDIEADQTAVAQEYITRPLLLGGLKFDLRVYVIVVGLGAAQKAFIVEEGLARFCTKVYTEPTGTLFESDWARDALRAHLTNTAVNKGSDDYDVDTSKRAMSDVLQQLREADRKRLLGFAFSEDSFWHQLDNIVSSWLALMSPVLRLTFRQASKAARSAALSRRKKSSGIRAFMAAQRAAAAASTQAAVPDAASKETAGPRSSKHSGKAADVETNTSFGGDGSVYTEYEEYLLKCRSAQVLGFDIMLDASGKMHLLEVNNSPSLSTEEIVRLSPSGSEVSAATSATCCVPNQSSEEARVQPHVVERCVCTDVGCEYSEGKGLPHIHREGELDRRIKSPVVEALMRLATSQDKVDTAAFNDGVSVRPLRSNESTSMGVPPPLRLLERAYATHFLDTDDMGPEGWQSSCLLSFSQPVNFRLPQSFRSTLLSLSAAEEADDSGTGSISLDEMITEWDTHMKQKYAMQERRSSSARFELGDIVGLLDRALRQGKLRGGLDLSAILGALASPAASN